VAPPFGVIVSASVTPSVLITRGSSVPTLRRSLSLLAATLLIGLLLPFTAAAAASVTLEGQLVLAHGEDFAAADAPHSHAPGTPDNHSHGPTSYNDYSVVTADGVSHKLVFTSGLGPDDFLNGATVRVRGLPNGTALVVGAGAGATQVVAQATVAAATTKKLAVLLVNFTSNTAQPWSIPTAAATMFTNSNSVANYFAEESDGQLLVTGDVYGYLTIDFDTTGCNYTDLAAKARAAAAAANINLSSYTNIQYAFPNLSSCGWAGLAYLPGTESWVNNALTLRVSSHELSHNFGVHHASTLACTVNGTRVSLSANLANCSASEYGDPFSVMGSASTRHTHNQQLASLGWLPTGQRLTVTTTGTYVLGAAEDVSAAVRAIQIARGDGTYLYLEIRRPTGTSFDNFSTSDPAVKGVSIRLSNGWTSIIQSKLLDATPQTTSFNDAPLPVGSTFTDPKALVEITTVSVDPVSYAATVLISWGADTAPPTMPPSLSASLASPTSVRLSWGGSTDNRGVTGYRVSRGSQELATVTGTTYTDTSLVPGAYGWTVVALDAAGNASAPASVSFTVPVPDTTAPTAPTNLRTTNLTKAKLTLAWNAATDERGVVGYRVYRGSTLVATVTSLTWSESRQRLATTYTVYAIDAAGNVSPASNAVTVAAK
jgi:hypothetical protein